VSWKYCKRASQVPVHGCPAVDDGAKAGKKYRFTAQKSDAGRKMLHYYPY
jgi:hypothetical protein